MYNHVGFGLVNEHWEQPTRHRWTRSGLTCITTLHLCPHLTDPPLGLSWSNSLFQKFDTRNRKARRLGTSGFKFTYSQWTLEPNLFMIVQLLILGDVFNLPINFPFFFASSKSWFLLLATQRAPQLQI